MIQLTKSPRITTLIMLLPWVIVFSAFWLYPLVYSGALSLTEHNILSNETTFIGLENYSRMLSDPIFWQALVNTCLFTLGVVPFTILLALFFASLLNNRRTRMKSFFKSTFFLPSITSVVVISLIFTNLYAKHGYINAILQALSLPYPDKGWLLSTETSLLSVMLMDIWSSFGYYMVIFIAAMQTIPQNIYDSAKLSGASTLYTLFRITVPLLRPTLIFILVINLIKSFQVFVEIYILTRGGPLNSSTTLVYMIYNNGFQSIDGGGYASAISYLLFFILLALSLIQLSLMRGKN